MGFSKSILRVLLVLLLAMGLLLSGVAAQAALRPQYLADKAGPDVVSTGMKARRLKKCFLFWRTDDLAELYQLVEAHPLVLEIRDYQHGGFNLRLYYGLRQVFFDEPANALTRLRPLVFLLA